MKFRKTIEVGKKYYARYNQNGFEYLHGIYEVLVIKPVFDYDNAYSFTCFVKDTFENEKHWTFEKPLFISEILDEDTSKSDEATTIYKFNSR